MDIKPGDIVYSRAGRDKNKPFVVTDTVDEQFVLLADGALRKLIKPKKKKVKHIKPTGNSFPEIAERLMSGGRVTNNELKKALGEFADGTDA